MNVKNCKRCGKMFNYIMGEPICTVCKERAEEVFQTVKKYVQDNKQATIQEIVENCDVEARQVKQWVREERLEFSAESSIGLECESCGTLIKVGRFCESCKNKMANGLAEAAGLNKKPEVKEKKKDPRESARMRFLDNH